MITGWYYLHTNKSLIFKPDPDAIQDIRESDFCHTAWAFDGQRLTAWSMLVEALALGADQSRIYELAAKWGCNDIDAIAYAHHVGADLDLDESKDKLSARGIHSPHLIGYGDTYLEAMAELCKLLGYVGGKIWVPTFRSLLKSPTALAG